MSDTPRTEIYVLNPQPECVHADFARQLERELNVTKAQNAEMKKLIRQIYYDTETYADGAPDASAHDKLCNEISSKLEPYLK